MMERAGRATPYADSDYAEALRPLMDYDIYILKYTYRLSKVLLTRLVEVSSSSTSSASPRSSADSSSYKNVNQH